MRIGVSHIPRVFLMQCHLIVGHGLSRRSEYGGADLLQSLISIFKFSLWWLIPGAASARIGIVAIADPPASFPAPGSNLGVSFHPFSH